MQRVFGGLQNFYKFLKTIEEYLKSEQVIKQLWWQVIPHEVNETSQDRVWVQLVEPPNSSENFEANFNLFLNENNREVYEFEPGGQISFHRNNRIGILDRDPDERKLLLEREPQEKDNLLGLRPNTYQIMCQIRAIRSLQDAPSKAHLPLLKLFEASDHAIWPPVPTAQSYYWEDRGHRDPVSEWYVLTDDQREGTKEQRDFVEIALNTPDFAFLEGPPGSGKTTAICELAIQLAIRRKRILLCASTHVAVDNVIERLMDDENPYRDCVLPIRIGDASRVSKKAKPWQLEEFLRTEKKRLVNALLTTENRTGSQQYFLDQLQQGSEIIQKMVLECANLVCGTTIGILQHPDIRSRDQQSPQFDVMIIDEASKTTFQEFLVPALLAERWVLVGDPKQLSPYVDDESTAINLKSCLPEDYKREACIDVFQSSQRSNKRRVCSLVASGDQSIIDYYRKQTDRCGVFLGNSMTPNEYVSYSSVVVGSENFIQSNENNLPLDIANLRYLDQIPESIKRQVNAYRRLREEDGDTIEVKTWEDEVSWRLSRLYEQRLNNEENRARGKLRSDLEQLHPHDDDGSVRDQIERVRRVALPSILESLQEGFERNPQQRKGTALSDGLPRRVLEQRLVKLSWQHRMHKDIADFPHRVIYQEEALFTPDDMDEKRDWTYKPDRKRCIWHDVPDDRRSRENKNNANEREVHQIMAELKAFDEWAQTNPNVDANSSREKPWEVAILTFYRDQEKKLRKGLRNWTGNHRGIRHFHRGGSESLVNRPYLEIQVCTVDRFQGQEADLVLLSFSKTSPTSFLESPNRLNVAITRARYQLVIFGKLNGMKRASGALSQLANQVTWDQSL